METENPSSPQPIGSLASLAVHKLCGPTSQAAADPARSVWIAARAKMVFGAYRKDDFADPESFLLQLGMVLERYPDDVIERLTGPVTGIQRQSKFPPAISEIVECCEHELERQAKIAELGNYRVERHHVPKPIERFNLLVPENTPSYARICDAVLAGKIECRQDERGVHVNYHDYLTIAGHSGGR